MAANKWVVFGFLQNGIPFHEGYGLLGVTSFDDAQNKALKMLAQRLLLCGEGVKCTGVRISQFPDFDRTIREITPAQNLWTDPAPIAVADDATVGERASSVVYMKFYDSIGRTSKRPLSGAPDQLHNETNPSGLRVDRVPGWLTAWNKWTKILRNDSTEPDAGPWAFRYFNYAGNAGLQIVDADVDTVDTGFLEIYVGGDQRAAYPVGSYLKIKGNRRILAGFKNPGGEWMVHDVALNSSGAQTIITLQGATGFDVSRWLPGRYGKIYKIQFDLTQIAQAQYIRSSIRQRKLVGFNELPGKARAKKSVT